MKRPGKAKRTEGKKPEDMGAPGADAENRAGPQTSRLSLSPANMEYRRRFLKKFTPFLFFPERHIEPILGAAERRAETCDRFAEWEEANEKQKRATEPDIAAKCARRAERFRKKATWWRTLAARNKAELNRDDLHEWPMIASEEIDLLLSLGEIEDAPWHETDEAPWHDLLHLLQQLHRGLHALATIGRKGAARALVDALYDAVNSFASLANRKPELFPFVRSGFGIPGIISPSGEQAALNERLVEKLCVGKEYPFGKIPSSRRGLKFGKQANALAYKLWAYIDHHRHFCREYIEYADDMRRENEQTAGWYFVYFREVPAWVRDESSGKYDCRTADSASLPAWVHDAVKLKAFSAKTWHKWAEVAWGVLAEVSPDYRPGLHPVFYDPKTKICNVRKTRRDPYFGKVTHAPSIAEQDIKEALFGAFEMVATGMSRRTKQRRKKAR